MLTVQVRTQEDVQAVEPEPAVSNVQYQHADYEQALASNNGDGGDTAVPSRSRRRSCAPGRRSGATIRVRAAAGKKYKHCHGRLGLEASALRWPTVICVTLRDPR